LTDIRHPRCLNSILIKKNTLVTFRFTGLDYSEPAIWGIVRQLGRHWFYKRRGSSGLSDRPWCGSCKSSIDPSATAVYNTAWLTNFSAG